MTRRHLIATSLLLLASGCSVFTGYPGRTEKARRAFAAFDFDGAVKRLEPHTNSGNDRLCYLLETGTVLHVKGDFAASTRRFSRAGEVMRGFEDRALISLRDTAAGAAAFLVNDKTMPYSGEGFEKILLHTYLALDYLLQKDLAGARVEIRRVYQRQKEEADRKEKLLEVAKKRARERGVGSRGIMDKIRGLMGEEKSVLGSAGNVYQNAFATYLSALVYELNGEPEEAYQVDLKTIHRFNPGLRLVRRDLLRLSRALGRGAEYRRWRQEFNEPEQPPKPDTGAVVLLHHCGRSPRKKAIRHMFPIPCRMFNPEARGSLLVAVSIPRYVRRGNPVAAARLMLGGRALGTTETFTDVEATAVRCLLDRMPAIVVRQLIRAVGKAAVQYKAKERGGPLAGLLVAGYTAVSEQADLRSWLTLPARLQVLRTPVPAGAHKMRIQILGSGGTALSEIHVKVCVRAGGMSIINLRSIGGAARAAVVDFSYDGKERRGDRVGRPHVCAKRFVTPREEKK